MGKLTVRKRTTTMMPLPEATVVFGTICVFAAVVTAGLIMLASKGAENTSQPTNDPPLRRRRTKPYRPPAVCRDHNVESYAEAHANSIVAILDSPNPLGLARTNVEETLALLTVVSKKFVGENPESKVNRKDIAEMLELALIVSESPLRVWIKAVQLMVLSRQHSRAKKVIDSFLYIAGGSPDVAPAEEP